MKIRIKKSPKEVETTFFSKIKLLKETSEVSIQDLTIIARVDSMMIIYIDHLDVKDNKLDHIHHIMKMWKLRLEQLGVLQ